MSGLDTSDEAIDGGASPADLLAEIDGMMDIQSPSVDEPSEEAAAQTDAVDGGGPPEGLADAALPSDGEDAEGENASENGGDQKPPVIDAGGPPDLVFEEEDDDGEGQEDADSESA